MPESVLMANSTADARRHVAIDFGLARIGIALSDPMQIIASPLTTLTCEKKLEKTAEKLYNFLEEHQKLQKYLLESIVIGLPLMMSGKTSFLADEVAMLASYLQKLTTIPIVLFDERLTTVQAERSLKEGGHFSRKQRAQKVDAVSAAILLQTYLEKIQQQKERNQAYEGC